MNIVLSPKMSPKMLSFKYHLSFVLAMLISLPVFAQENRQSNLAVSSVPDVIHHTFLVNERIEKRMRVDLLKIELAKLVAQRLGVNPVNHACPFKRCMADLYSGQGDLIFFPSVSDARKEYLTFFNVITFQQSSLSFVVRKGEEEHLKNLSDLRDLTVGVVSGYYYAAEFSEDNEIAKHEVSTEQQLPELLLSNQIDAFVVYKWLQHEEYPEITEAPFQLPVGDIAFAGISKASPHYLYFNERLPDILNNLIMEGHLKRLCLELRANCFPEMLDYRP